MQQEQRARTHFHLALGSILLVPFAPFVSGAFALLHWRDPPHPFRARLAALAAVDVLVVVCFILLTKLGPEPTEAATAVMPAADAQGPRTGANIVGVGLVLASLVLLTVAGAVRGATWKPGLIATSAFVLAALTSTGVALALGAAGVSALPAALVAMAVGSSAMGILGALGARTVPTSAPATPVSTLEAFGRALLYAFGGGIRIGVVATTLSTLLKLPTADAAEAFGLTVDWGPLAIALFVVAGVIVAPLAEEALFRGLLMPWLSTWMGERAALFVSAGAFALGHLFYGANAAVTFVYGLALGWARLATGRLRASIAAHACVNAVAVTALIARDLLSR